MSSAVSRPPLPTGGPSASGDEFDDLNDYDIELDDPTDPFGNNYQVPQDKNASSKNNSEREKGKSGDGLGLDEEVEVTRKARAPRVKLDEHRLLSAAGIPRLRKKAREHLKFKGKGHEYSDASRLLAFYQLWLDDLFPKARFLDALAMVEKMGHKKMMQSARMEWINEGKPHSGVHEDSLFDEPQVPRREKERAKTAERVAPIFEKGKEGERNKTPAGNVDDLFGDDEDIYGATPKAARTQATAPAVGGGTSLFGPAKNTGGDEEFPDDDIDALLAEEESMRTSKPAAKPVVQQDDDMDDMDALLAEEEATRVEKPAATTTKPSGGKDDDDMDDIDALLAEEEAMRAEKPKEVVSKLPAVQSQEFDDDMEAMAEMDGLWD